MRIAICSLGAAILILLIVGVILLDRGSALVDRKDAEYRHLYGLYLEELQKSSSTSPDEDAKAIRNYQALAEQYKAMVDELYEHGERIASGRVAAERLPGGEHLASKLGGRHE